MIRAVSAALATLALSACAGSTDELSGSGGTQSPISVGGEAQKNPPTPPAERPAGEPAQDSDLPSRPQQGSGITVHDCPTHQGYTPSFHARQDPGEPDMVVLGIYESRADHGGGYHPEGTATVHVKRTTPHTLVLSSYEPTLWKIDAEPGARIERIVLNGLHPQRVTGVGANVKVTDRSGRDYLSACAYKWPGDDQGCDTQALVSGLRTLTSREVTAFAGCYRATEFTVGETTSRPPPNQPNPPTQPNPPNPNPPNPNPPNPNPPAVKHTVTCTPGQGTLTTYVAPKLEKSELHLLGVYESNSDHSYGYHPEGEATVDVDRTAPLILALSSYEPIHWTVKAVPGARIERIILNGHHAQRVTAPQGIPVDNRSGRNSLGAYAYAWPSSQGGSDTPELVSKLEQLTARPLSSFAGCYQGTAFRLE